MIHVFQEQSMIDLAIQTSGSAEAVILLSLVNDRSVTDYLYPGEELKTAGVVNKQVTDYYKNKGLTPATALTGVGGSFDETFDETFD